MGAQGFLRGPRTGIGGAIFVSFVWFVSVVAVKRCVHNAKFAV